LRGCGGDLKSADRHEFHAHSAPLDEGSMFLDRPDLEEESLLPDKREKDRRTEENLVV